MKNVDEIIYKLSEIILSYLQYKKIGKNLNQESIACFLSTNEDFLNLCESIDFCDLSKDVEKVSEYLLMLSMYVDDKNLEEKVVKLKNITDCQEFKTILIEAFSIILQHFEQLSKSLEITGDFFTKLIHKLDKTHSKAILALKEKLEVTKKDYKTNKNLFNLIDDVKKDIFLEGKIENLAQIILDKMDEISNMVDDTIKEKEKRIEKFSSEFEELSQGLEEYRQRAKKLQNHIEKYKLESITDYLTGLYNRKYLDVRLEEEQTRVNRLKSKFSVIMLDIDDFKKINDTYGHIVGDYVLKFLSNIVVKTLRKVDVAFRYGGEEFLLLLPGIDLKNATFAAERLRKEIEKTVFKYKDENIKITVSQGVAEYIDSESFRDTIERADNNLLKSKDMGKNRVVCE